MVAPPFDKRSGPLGTFTDYAGFVALLRQRKAALGLSDLVLDEIAGFADGHSGKLLGPGQAKGIGPRTFTPLLDALGLSGALYADPDKTAHQRAARRREDRVRDNGRIGRDAIRKVRPIVMAELARRGARARWAKATPADRAIAVAKMNAARLAKRAER